MPGEEDNAETSIFLLRHDWAKLKNICGDLSRVIVTGQKLLKEAEVVQAASPSCFDMWAD
eukprot:4501964-Amphidinium_carterae.1